MSLRHAVVSRCWRLSGSPPIAAAEQITFCCFELAVDELTDWGIGENLGLVRTHGTTGLDGNGILKIRFQRGHSANNAANPEVRHTFSQL